MRFYEKVVTKFGYLFSKKLKKQHLKELRFHLASNQALTSVLEDTLNNILRMPLREREKRPDYMKANFDKMRAALKNLRDAGNVLRERIEVIDPTFPKAQLNRKR